MVVALGTWEEHRLDVGETLSGCAMSADGLFYYLKRMDNGDAALMRADLADGTITDVYRFQHPLNLRSLGTVTTDRRYYAVGTMLEPGWKTFDVTLVDLKTGTQTMLDRDPFILNSHPQFEPGVGRTLMIQHNRGGTYTADGKLERLVGPRAPPCICYRCPAANGLNCKWASRTQRPARATKRGLATPRRSCFRFRPAELSLRGRGACWESAPGNQRASSVTAIDSIMLESAVADGCIVVTTGNRPTGS